MELIGYSEKVLLTIDELEEFDGGECCSYCYGECICPGSRADREINAQGVWR